MRLLIPLVLLLATAAFSHAGDWPGWQPPAGPDAFWHGPGRTLEPTEAEREAGRMLAAAKEDAYATAAARLMRGLARYRQGRWRSAATDLKRAARGPLHNADIADFFRAECAFHAGDYVHAEAQYKRFQKRYPHSTWRHRATVRLADVALALDRPAEAVKGYDRVLDLYPEYPHRAAIRFALAEAERLRGRFDASARWLDRIINELPEDPLALVAERALQALEAQGAELPTQSVEAALARGIDLRSRKYFHPALDTLQRLTTDPRTTASDRWKARYQIGRTLYQMERYEEALASFSALIDDAAAPSRKRWATRWKSYCLERLGRLDPAAQALMVGMGTDPKAPSAEAQYEVGWLYFNGAEYEKAATWFGQAARRGRAWASKTHWLRAWLAYRLGDYKTAAEAFKRLQASSRARPERYGYWLARTLARQGEIEAAVDTYKGLIDRDPLSYYAYQARARLEELGRPLWREPDADGAPEAEDETAEEGIACGEGDERPGCRLVDADGADEPESPEAAAAEPGATEGEELPQSAAEPTADDDAVAQLRRLSERWGGAMPAFAKAYELAVIGEPIWAMQHLRLVSDELRAFYRAGRKQRARWQFEPDPYVDYRDLNPPRAEWGRRNTDRGPRSDTRRVRFLAARRDKAFWPQLRDAFAALGDYHYARRLARKEDRVSGRPEGPENQKWRNRYARAFQPIVEANARHYGLDPHFIWALMTVESTYNPWAVSRASARGLLQVMPHTGALVADRMHWRNFGPALLFEPEVAIEMAAWYFNELLQKFNGQLPLAIAGYNAGPHRVAWWLTRKGHLPMDEFIEEIPYTEAREYTKKVLKYLALYHRIYRGEDELRVVQIIDPDFRSNINF
ncbi:MAG: transglycosylase SLT domain-containing protein [Myxococcales bacterium]|nr:transglycosylase SLT domain-containing protein [Myxococcales bacterium]